MNNDQTKRPGPPIRGARPQPATRTRTGDLMQGEPQEQTLHVDRQTINRYVAGVLAIGIPVLTIPAVVGLPGEPFILILVYVLLLGGSILVARGSGPGGVRRLFSGVLHWRIGWRNWAIAVAAIPVATIAVAAATGTYTGPTDGWLAIVGGYLFLTFVFGALIINIFEETAWQGLVQRHFTQRYGLLKGAGLTAIPFAAVHLPLSFVGDVTTSEALVASAFLIVSAPVMRYVMGRTDHATGGSLLAVGVMHASFNASGQLGVMDGDWQHMGGTVIVAALFLLVDVRRSRARPGGLYSDAVTAASPGTATVS